MIRTKHYSHQGQNAAFTLLEVLIAMGIFAIGFVAVAAIFPAAAIMQKNTVDDVLAQQATRNAMSMAEAFTSAVQSSLRDALDTNVPDDMFVAEWPDTLDLDFTISENDRSFPSAGRPLDSQEELDEDLVNRKFYWELLVMRRQPRPTASKWTIFLFVMRMQGKTIDERFSGVQHIDVTTTNDADRFVFDNDPDKDGRLDLVRIGDLVLANNGLIYRVQEAYADGVTIAGFISTNTETGEYPDGLWIGQPLTDNHPSVTIEIKPFKGLLE